MRKLEDRGLVAAVPHATDLTPPARRFHLTGAGLKRLAGYEGLSLDEPLRGFPVSAHWRRLLLGRLDAVAIIYRLRRRQSRTAALVQGHAGGRRCCTTRWQDRRHRSPGTHIRQDGLRQAAVETQGGAASRRRFLPHAG